MTASRPLNVMRLQKYYEWSGDTPEAVRNRRKKGHWTDGVQSFIAPDGNIWVNLPEVELWVTKNYRPLANAVKRSKRLKA